MCYIILPHQLQCMSYIYILLTGYFAYKVDQRLKHGANMTGEVHAALSLPLNLILRLIAERFYSQKSPTKKYTGHELSC